MDERDPAVATDPEAVGTDPEIDDQDPAVAQRFSASAPIYLQFPGEENPLTATIGNISETGLYVVCETTFPAGTDFNFRIAADRPIDTVTGRGRVAWRRRVSAGSHRPPGMGCQILRLSDESRDALLRRLQSASERALFRAPPDRRSLTQEFARTAVDDALKARGFAGPDYFGSKGVAKPERNRRGLAILAVILGSILVLAAALWLLVTFRIVELPIGGVRAEARDGVPEACCPAPAYETARITASDHEPGQVRHCLGFAGPT